MPSLAAIDKLHQGGFVRLVRDQTALNRQHHPLDCKHVGSLFVERVGYHERRDVSVVRNQQAKRRCTSDSSARCAGAPRSRSNDALIAATRASGRLGSSRTRALPKWPLR